MIRNVDTRGHLLGTTLRTQQAHTSAITRTHDMHLNAALCRAQTYRICCEARAAARCRCRIGCLFRCGRLAFVAKSASQGCRLPAATQVRVCAQICVYLFERTDNTINARWRATLCGQRTTTPRESAPARDSDTEMRSDRCRAMRSRLIAYVLAVLTWIWRGGE